MSGFKNLAEIEAVEQTPLAERNYPPTTYEMLQRGAAVDPNHTALHFFLQGTAFDKPTSYTYRQLMSAITQTANMLHDLGIGKNDVVSMVLPSLPQAHFTIWGGEAAGIVNPINPLLEAQQMADIMNAAETKVLVTLSAFPGVDIWQKVASIADQIPTLETILQVHMENFLPVVKKIAVKFM
ncbi:MAG TPA: acyl-CoA synthetase, partial [Anaerolineae bacterium]|nr:acyl-CoA synthetase [Anaerolineae bacterium]